MSHSRKKTYGKVLLNLGVVILTLLFCLFILPRLIGLFMPFIVGWLIALLASPMVRFLEEKLKIKRKAGSAVVIVLVIALIILFGYLGVSFLVEQISGFVEELPQMWKTAEKELDEMGGKLSAAFWYLPAGLQTGLAGIGNNLEEYFSEFVGKLSEPTVAAIGNAARNIPGILISVIMSLLFAYFYVIDRERIARQTEKILPGAVLNRLLMIRRGFKNAVGGYFKAQLKIEFWMYILLCIGFMILGVSYAFLLALLVAFLDLLPFLGTGTVLLPWAVVKFMNGDYKMVIGLLIIWSVGQLARQIIQPKILGDSVGLPPMPTLILLFLGYQAAGVIGMLFAVPIGIIIRNLYEEGVFDTTIKSLMILYAGINNFRRLDEEDMEEVRRYKAREEVISKDQTEDTGAKKEG